MEITDSEREVLEWIRDEDERVATIAAPLRDTLMRKGLILTSMTSFVGQSAPVHYRLTSRGSEALKPKE